MKNDNLIDARTGQIKVTFVYWVTESGRRVDKRTSLIFDNEDEVNSMVDKFNKKYRGYTRYYIKERIKR